MITSLYQDHDHMRMLRNRDWEKANRMVPGEPDPLFGDVTDEIYAMLYHKISGLFP